MNLFIRNVCTKAAATEHRFQKIQNIFNLFVSSSPSASVLFFFSLLFPPSGVSLSLSIFLSFSCSSCVCLGLSAALSLALWSVSTASAGLQEAVIHLPRIKQCCQQPDWHTKRPGCLHTLTHTHTKLTHTHPQMVPVPQGERLLTPPHRLNIEYNM